MLTILDDSVDFIKKNARILFYTLFVKSIVSLIKNII